MPLPSTLADIAQKSAVLLLAGTTVYYVINVGMLVNRRMELKKNGKLEEELARLTGAKPPSNTDNKEHNTPRVLHADTATTPTPIPEPNQPGNCATADELH